MRFNPFRPGRIAGPGMFAGRGAELVELERILSHTQSSNAQHFMLTGERGIGKSSLLLFLKLIATGEIKEGYKFLVLEIELEPTTTYTQLIKQIAGALKRGLAPFEKIKAGIRAVWDVVKNIEAAGFRYGASALPDDHELLEELVGAFASATRELKGTIDGIVLLIDEADKAPSEAHLGAFCKLFTDRLTKRQCDNVCVGLAGVTGLVQKLRSSHESAPRIFTVMSLKPLEPSERVDVIKRGLDHSNEKNDPPVTITQEALDAVSNMSEGFPHFIQQFAYCAFEEDDDNSIEATDVYMGALRENGALDQLGEKYFQQMYFERINSNEYRAVLQAMAQTTDPDGWTTKEQIRKATSLKETTLGNAISTLKTKEIIIPKLGEKGIYRLPNQSFAAWIRARQLSAEVAGTSSDGRAAT